MPEQTDDHDRLIEVVALMRKLDGDVASLREWRHDSITPVVISIQSQQSENVKQITQLTQITTRLAESIAHLSVLPAELRRHQDECVAGTAKMEQSTQRLANMVESYFSAARKRSYAVVGMMGVTLVGIIVWLIQNFVLTHAGQHAM